MDGILRSEADSTPESAWAGDSRYALSKEQELCAELLDAERGVEIAQKRKEEVRTRLKAAGSLGALLYEKGKRLEHLILEALQILGFQATSYRDSESEFEVVFESDEGRRWPRLKERTTKLSTSISFGN
ncbi:MULTISPECIES: hypothetical protein [unclassified Bradyrhizobium]